MSTHLYNKHKNWNIVRYRKEFPKAKTISSGYREQHSKALVEAWNKPGVRKARGKVMKIVQGNPDYKKRHSKIMKIVMNKPEVKEKHRRALKSRKTREKMSNSAFNGGSAPEYGYNWKEQRVRALERSNGFDELTEELLVGMYGIHHEYNIFDAHKDFLELVYPTLAKICEQELKDKKPYFAMFEQSIRLGHKNYKHFKGLVVSNFFPKFFYNELNALDKLWVVSNSIHHSIERIPRSQWHNILGSRMKEERMIRRDIKR